MLCDYSTVESTLESSSAPQPVNEHVNIVMHNKTLKIFFFIFPPNSLIKLHRNLLLKHNKQISVQLDRIANHGHK